MLVCYNALLFLFYFYFFLPHSNMNEMSKGHMFTLPTCVFGTLYVVVHKCTAAVTWQIFVRQKWTICIFNSNSWATSLPMTSFCWMYTVFTVSYNLPTISITLLRKFHFWHIRQYLYFLWPKNCFCLIAVFTYCKCIDYYLGHHTIWRWSFKGHGTDLSHLWRM